MQKAFHLSGACLVLSLFATNAWSSVITVSDASRGWMSASSSDGSRPDNNYIAGNCYTTACGAAGEHRDFFTFAIPALNGPVVSAVLTLSTGTIGFTQGSTATYQITSIPTSFGFANLGIGTVFGSFVYSAADTGANESIALNAAGLAAIKSNTTFEIGGRITTLLPNGGDEYIFGSTGPASIAQLTITTAPEPASWALCALVLGGICFVRRRVLA